MGDLAMLEDLDVNERTKKEIKKEVVRAKAEKLKAKIKQSKYIQTVERRRQIEFELELKRIEKGECYDI
jgi:hypothetical protein